MKLLQCSEDDMVNIVVSTDNHVGFMEKDPVRRDDSFHAFEEVLVKAKENKVNHSPRKNSAASMRILTQEAS